MKKIKMAFFIAAFMSLLIVPATFAQTEELTLKMSRDFGYGGFNNDIQGLFSMKVTGPADLARVVFYIDSTAIGEVTQAPFNLQFNTDNYPLGQHKLHAVGYSSSGQQYNSNIINSNFVMASESTKIVVPILVIVFGAILLSFIVPLVMGRGKTQNLPLGAERKYGLGGGICPKCRRPFALPLISVHLGFTKLARCPYCGKIGLVRVESIDKLREAEKAELEWGKVEVKEETEEEKLRKEIDDSKYQ
ncbi:MAG: Ig-like domain-containing protein [Chloroflexi bacterium]|nr:Ig-like domain-containing protein [Chloroflexota bacterium]